MKLFIKILLGISCFFGIERLTRTQTHGFRLHKVQADFTPTDEWEITNAVDIYQTRSDCWNLGKAKQSQMDTTEEHYSRIGKGYEECSFDKVVARQNSNNLTESGIDSILQQPFYFLGSGVQFYAFESRDHTTVLKLFKQYHLPPSSKLLKCLPLPKYLDGWRNNVLAKRENRLTNIFQSSIIAAQKMPQQTGVFHLHLNPTKGKYPPLTLYDNIGICHTIDLNRSPFLLQKKADLLFPYLETHRGEIKQVIDSLFTCILTRTHLGITNTDGVIAKNYGICDGKVLEIDVGSFSENPSCKHDLSYETREMKKWLTIHSPEHLEYFDNKLRDALQT